MHLRQIKPPHRVSIKPFKISKYEITLGQFRQFVIATDYVSDAEKYESCGYWNNDRKGMAYDRGYNWHNPGFPQSDDTHPVVCISWNDAQAFIIWLNQITDQHYRLPTEAEWEYAARAGTTTKYSFGNNSEYLCEFANGYDLSGGRLNMFPGFKFSDCDDGYVYTAPVGKFKANYFGLFDMHGNVFEWVEDCWHENYLGAPTDGSAWLENADCDLRTRRGASWDYEPDWMVITIRYREPRNHSYHNRGFRLAADQ